MKKVPSNINTMSCAEFREYMNKDKDPEKIAEDKLRRSLMKRFTARLLTKSESEEATDSTFSEDENNSWRERFRNTTIDRMFKAFRDNGYETMNKVALSCDDEGVLEHIESCSEDAKRRFANVLSCVFEGENDKRDCYRDYGGEIMSAVYSMLDSAVFDYHMSLREKADREVVADMSDSEREAYLSYGLAPYGTGNVWHCSVCDSVLNVEDTVKSGRCSSCFGKVYTACLPGGVIDIEIE